MAHDFDPAQLEEVTGGDPDFERELLTEYLNSAPDDLLRLRAALDDRNATAAAASAHALKGSSATIGAQAVAMVAAELELAAKRNELADAPAGFARLEREFAALTLLLRGRIDRAA